MKNKMILALLFGCIGIAAEIIFTGFKYNIILPVMHHQQIKWDLTGTSYVWMFFIYGAIPFLFPPVYHALRSRNLLIRISAYGLICLTVEFIAGWLLDLLTGSCPWEYTTRWNILGYIRLDYFPVWMIFGWAVERIYLFLRNLIRP